MSTVTQHGYLVMADISGYTSFVARTELEHSHEILSDLLELLVNRFKSLLTISKLEGDAVFAYVGEEKITRGETLLEFMEATYVAFRDKQVSMKRATTCTCLACQNIPSLDLKFFAHHGDYIVQRVGEMRELVGSDVNLIHRLTKNHVAEATGWRAYMMITDQCLDHLKLGLDNVHIQVEDYEHLREVKTYNIDLRQRYNDITEQRRILIDEKDADLVVIIDFPTPPAITWEWIQDPVRRNSWSGGHVHWSLGERPRGRAGKGASNHCAHGEAVSTEVTLDWRPFEYSTADSYQNGRKTFSETLYFDPLPDGGTRLRDCMQVHMPLPRFVRKWIARRMVLGKMQYDQTLLQAARMAGDEFSKAADET